MAILNFDANTVAPDTGGFEALPAGWYKVMMESSEMKPTKDNTGSYLECKYKVLDGAHTGKSVFGRLNLRNANAQAQEIAYKQLSAICHATGVLQVSDSAQLHNIPLQIKLKLREARKEHDAQGNVVKEYEANNEISAYKNINEQVGTPVASGFPAQTPSASPAFTPPPAPPAFAPPMQQAPQQTPTQQWQPPAAQQPWAPPQQQQQPVQQMPQQQVPIQQWQPPVQQQQVPQPPFQPAAPNGPGSNIPQQQFQPPAQQQQPVQQQQPNPAAAQAQTATPPWMQQPAQA